MTDTVINDTNVTNEATPAPEYNPNERECNCGSGIAWVSCPGSGATYNYCG